MLRILSLSVALTFASAAHAQQQPQMSPSELALNINSAVTQMAQVMEQQTKLIKKLQDDIAELKKPAPPQPTDTK